VTAFNPFQGLSPFGSEYRDLLERMYRAAKLAEELESSIREDTIRTKGLTQFASSPIFPGRLTNSYEYPAGATDWDGTVIKYRWVYAFEECALVEPGFAAQFAPAFSGNGGAQEQNFWAGFRTIQGGRTGYAINGAEAGNNGTADLYEGVGQPTQVGADGSTASLTPLPLANYPVVLMLEYHFYQRLVAPSGAADIGQWYDPAFRGTQLGGLAPRYVFCTPGPWQIQCATSSQPATAQPPSRGRMTRDPLVMSMLGEM
jgi:hypothetical protein